MPLVIAPFVCFALGALLALAHPGPLGARGLQRGRAVAALFALLTVWPSLGYVVTRAPAWAMLFVADPRSLAPAVLVAGSLVASALLSLGYEAGIRVASADPKLRLALPLVPSAFAVLLAALYGDRLLTLASYDAWSRSAPSPGLFTTGFGASLVAADLLLAVGFGVAFRALAPVERPAGRASTDDAG